MRLPRLLVALPLFTVLLAGCAQPENVDDAQLAADPEEMEGTFRGTIETYGVPYMVRMGPRGGDLTFEVPPGIAALNVTLRETDRTGGGLAFHLVAPDEAEYHAEGVMQEDVDGVVFTYKVRLGVHFDDESSIAVVDPLAGEWHIILWGQGATTSDYEISIRLTSHGDEPSAVNGT